MGERAWRRSAGLRRSRDRQIAAIAHANDLVLVTLNIRDFARFKEVAVENWSKRCADR